MPKEKFKLLRTSILSMVLATDMAVHFEYIAKFKNKTNGAGMRACFYSLSPIITGLDVKEAKDRQMLMDIAVKCADINNAAKKEKLCLEWAKLIMEEFWDQGDKEKQMNIPVSMFMDRATCRVEKCQVGFIDYIVTPLYEAWDAYVTDEEVFPALQYLAENREYWKSKCDENDIVP